MSISQESIRVQPWFNKKEFQEVASKIFSAEVEDQKWAVEVIAAWKMRVGPELDKSIVVTGDLVAANIEFELMEPADPHPAKITSLQSQYSMAIIRFINCLSHLQLPHHRDMAFNEVLTDVNLHLVPTNQNMDRSVNKMLADMGLPEVISNLHHDANHADYPPLEMLRHGTDVVLEWLQENYWQPMESHIQDFCPKPQAISQLLDQYQKAAYQMVVNKNQRHILEPILNKLNKFITKNEYKFFEILASPGHLLPPTYYLTTLEQSKGESYVESLHMPVELPALGRAMWLPLLKLINSCRLLQVLAESLLLAQDCYSPSADRMAIAWVSYLITLGDDSNLGIIPAWDWQPLLKCAITSPSKYILDILSVFLENQDPPLSEEKKQKLVTLVAVYQGALTDYRVRDEPGRGPTYTRRDMEIIQHGTQLEKHPDSNPGPWCLYEDPDPAHPLPLGSLIMEQNTEEPPSEQTEFAPVASAAVEKPDYHHSGVSLEDPVLKVKPSSSPSLLSALEKYLGQTVLM